MIWLSVTCHIVHHALHHTSSLIVLHHTSSLDGYYSIYSYCTLSILYKSASPQKWLRLLFQNKLDQGTEQRTKENKVRIIQFTPISQTYASPLLHQPKKKKPIQTSHFILNHPTLKHFTQQSFHCLSSKLLLMSTLHQNFIPEFAKGQNLVLYDFVLWSKAFMQCYSTLG